MSFFETEDGTRIFYKDWGHGPPVVFSHCWPLNADVWDEQLALVAQRGFRGVAHDRRGHGRSGQPWDGNTLDSYADDLASLLNVLDLRDVTLVGHSVGGGEVTRYIGRHGTERVSRAMLVDPLPPLALATRSNPEGHPLAVFDSIRTRLTMDRSQTYADFAVLFYGANRPGAKVSQGLLDAFWFWAMQAGYRGVLECIRVISETDITEDLKRIDVPTLIIHGDDDQIVPFADAALLAARLVRGARLEIYPGAPHGLPATHREEFNADLLSFLGSRP